MQAGNSSCTYSGLKGIYISHIKPSSSSKIPSDFRSSLLAVYDGTSLLIPHGEAKMKFFSLTALNGSGRKCFYGAAQNLQNVQIWYFQIVLNGAYSLS